MDKRREARRRNGDEEDLSRLSDTSSTCLSQQMMMGRDDRSRYMVMEVETWQHGTCSAKVFDNDNGVMFGILLQIHHRT